jgi:hypothetical protein
VTLLVHWIIYFAVSYFQHEALARHDFRRCLLDTSCCFGKIRCCFDSLFLALYLCDES